MKAIDERAQRRVAADGRRVGDDREVAARARHGDVEPPRVGEEAECAARARAHERQHLRHAREATARVRVPTHPPLGRLRW